MLRKPDTCRGCPAYGNGLGFVPDELIEGAEVAICGQNPGANEVAGARITHYEGKEPVTVTVPPAPYLGATGYVMERKFFPLAGLERGKVSILNAMRCRWGSTNTMQPLDSVEQRAAIEHCTVAHRRIPASTRVIIAEGEYALWSLTGEGRASDRFPGPPKGKGYAPSNTISTWRGYVLPYNPPPMPRVHATDVFTPGPRDIAVLATYHLAYLFHAPWDEGVCRRDWAKVPLILAGKWPRPLPSIASLPPLVWPAYSAFDTEFAGDWLTRYSMTDGTKLYVVERDEHQTPVSVEGSYTVAMHNAEADLEHLNRLLPGMVARVEDTMYKHAALWPDMAHDLGYIGSLYAPNNAWKHLMYSNPRVYAGGDAWATYHIDRALDRELAKDPATARLYRENFLPLLPIIAKARRMGIRVNQPQARMILKDLDVQQIDALQRAHAACGWPINLNSPPQVSAWLALERAGKRKGVK